MGGGRGKKWRKWKKKKTEGRKERTLTLYIGSKVEIFLDQKNFHL
jgi:hypothetical protein